MSLASELQLLWRATHQVRSRFLIVQYNHYDLVRQVLGGLEARYPERPLHRFDLSMGLPDGFPHNLLELGSGLICLEHFEELLKPEQESSAVALNQRRDAFADKDIQVLFFLPAGEAAIQAFAQRLPDLYSTVNPLIQLEQPVTASVGTPERLSSTASATYANRAEAEADIRHIRARLATLEDRPENVALRLMLRLNMGKANHFLGHYEEAKAVLAPLLEEEALNETPTERSAVQSALAETYQALGDYARAKGLLEKAMASNEQNLGSDHPSTAVSYSNLATVLHALGDYAGAKGLLEKAIKSDEQNFGPDHPATAVRYSNLAIVLQDLGDYAGAKSLLEKALRSNEQNFGPDHPTTAASYSNLALVLQYLGDYAGAKSLLEKAIKSDEQNLGPDHPTTAGRYWNLATVLMDLGDYIQARKLLEKALAVFHEGLGEGHPYTQGVSNWLEQLEVLEQGRE